MFGKAVIESNEPGDCRYLTNQEGRGGGGGGGGGGGVGGTSF